MNVVEILTYIGFILLFLIIFPWVLVVWCSGILLIHDYFEWVIETAENIKEKIKEIKERKPNG